MFAFLLLIACWQLPAPDQAPPAPPEATLPAPSVEGIPGWLGLRVGPVDGHEDGLNVDGVGPIVVVSEAWGSVAAGAAIERVDSTGTAAAPFIRSQRVRYGCDDGEETFASFAGSTADTLVWLVPAGTPAESIPVKTEDRQASRTWSIGTLTMSATRIGPDTVELREGRHLLETVDLDSQRMDGGEDVHLDVREDFMVPQVKAAWRIGSRTVVGATYSSWEGRHFVVYTLDEQPQKHHVGYLFGCAF